MDQIKKKNSKFSEIDRFLRECVKECSVRRVFCTIDRKARSARRVFY